MFLCCSHYINTWTTPSDLSIIFKFRPTTRSADFPFSLPYDEVEVAFTSLPGGLTKQLLIHGCPYCIQTRQTSQHLVWSKGQEKTQRIGHQDTSGFLSTSSDSDW